MPPVSPSVAPTSHARTLVIAFLVVVAAFTGSTLYADVAVSSMEARTRSMRENALPSIRHLTEARTALRHVEVLADHLVEGAHGHDSAEEIDRAKRHLTRELDAYASLPSYGEDEGALLAEARAHYAELDTATRRIVALVGARELEAARDYVDQTLRPAADRADASLTRMSEVNAEDALRLTRELEDLRARATQIAMLLDLSAALIAIGAVVLTLRTFRRYARLVGAHDRVLEERAAELESFAGRVAHDILSPLSASAFAMKFATRTIDEQSQAREMLDRGLRSLGRVRSVVDGLFEFARSGAAPAAPGRTRVRATMEALAEEARMTAAAEGFEIVVAPFEDMEAACGQGVLASIVSNLLNNALRYTKEAPVRRVEMRAAAHGDRVRGEVEDTGPGIATGAHETIFLPYVRGAEATYGGIGLGLATVKRLVEAHGGSVGVRSTFGQGSVFWFELPSPPASTDE